MPKAITAIFGGDARPFGDELRRMEAMASNSGKNISSTLFKTTPKDAAKDYSDWWEKMSKEGKLSQTSPLKLANDPLKKTFSELERNAGVAGSVAGGNFISRFISRMHGTGSGGISQLVHVFRASFDSLASGISPFRVLMQQGPQAAQALMLAGGGMLRMFGMVGVAIGIGAGAIAFMASLIRKANEVREAGRSLLNVSEALHNISEAAREAGDAFSRARLEAEAFYDSLDRTKNALDEDKNSYDVEVDTLKRAYELEKNFHQLRKERALALAHTPKDERRISRIYDDQQAAADSRLEADILGVRARQQSAGEGRQGDLNAAAAAARADKAAADATAEGVKAQKKSLEDSLAAVKKWKDDHVKTATTQDQRDTNERNRHNLQKQLDQLEQERIPDAERAAAAADRELKAKEALALENKRQAEMLEKENKKLAAEHAANDRMRSDRKTIGAQIDAAANRKHGEGANNYGLNAQQRLGAYAATPPDLRTALELLRAIRHNTNHLNPGPVRVGSQPTRFGGATKH